MIIGITGNSGSGKTDLSKMIAKKIKNKSVTILDADKIAKELAKPGNDYYKEIIKLFGSSVLLKDGTLNRGKIAKIIFENTNKRKLLDKITFKYVVEETKKRIEKSRSKFIIIDAPLLIESKINKLCDIVISVIASKDVKIDRICKRDGIDIKTAKLRLKSQKQDKFYIKNSNYVVVNNNINIKKQAEDILEFINSKCYNNEIVVIQDSNLKIMQFKKLLKYKNIAHAYTLKPLDFANNNSYLTNKEAIINNYKALCDFLKIDNKKIVRPHQTHTNNVVKINKQEGIYTQELMNIDGMITDKPNKILSLGFADCTPLFLYDKEKNIIANVHSGWQGTTKHIIMEAIKKMKKEYNCNPEDLLCFIGPTIRKCHFKVEDDVRSIFIDSFKGICEPEEYIKDAGIEEGNQKYYIDTVYLNKRMILKCGVPKKNIIDSNVCTACEVILMHSFRIEQEKSGRSTAIICKKY